MIEKYEDANQSYQQSFQDFSASGSSYYYFYWGYSGKHMNELLGISDYIQYNKIDNNYTSGYLPDKDGNYYTTNNRTQLPNNWPNDVSQYALADNNGYKYSQYLLELADNNGYNDVHSTYPKMGQLLKTFLSSTDALTYTDWHIPSCRQIALFYVFQSDINSALSKIGGTPLASTYYWSSTEAKSGNYGWYLDLSTGSLTFGMLSYARVRFVRNL